MKPEIDLKDYESGFARFDSLMQFRVKNILLVSSLYDSFILEEDGMVGELISSDYQELNLSMAPQIKRVSTGEEALNLMRVQKFDLILIIRRLGDIDMKSFSKQAKGKSKNIPIVLLAFDPRDLEILKENGHHNGIDKAFLWSGESNILMAIIKYVEDKVNVDSDTRLVGVRVIIIIEDSVRFYSSYLPLVYAEIVQQTQNLMHDGLNMAHRMLRMRARPKILLAETYEEGWELFKKYQKYLLGIISDVRFSMGGRIEDQAGIMFASEVKEKISDLPILLQSSNLQNAELATRCKVAFLHKKTRTLLADLRSFILKNFGFGDFVFRAPDGDAVARASDFHSMEKCLKMIPAESLVYHGSRNHFSNWLMARTEFDLAARLRPRKVTEFKNAETMRNYLIDTFRNFRHEKQLGIVADFSRTQFDKESDFVKIGSGSLGGKGRGLAFVNRLLRRYNVYNSFEGVQISVPSTTIIGTSVFDRFIEQNNLLEFALGDRSDNEIAQAFVNSKLPKDIVSDLGAFIEIVDYPIAVRSSSLLEDSHYQPFAGIFDTHMLPNCHKDIKVRLERLTTAIKYIFASIFFKNSKNYIEATANRVEEEKMAVVIQRVVGRNRNNTFYPILSGVARSYNFYSIGNIKPEEGVTYAALGLGKTIVEGEKCLFFSPSNPNNLPQFSTPKDYLKNSQHEFYAIDMTDPYVAPIPGGDMGLTRLRTEQAEADGSLVYVGSTYSPDNDRVYDGTSREGIKIVTMAPILKSKIFPLAEITRLLLQMGSNGMNSPVEIEFAAELNSDNDTPNEFGFLQIRPMAANTIMEEVSFKSIKKERIFCQSDQALSNGRNKTIRDIIFVRLDTFDRSQTPLIANQVGKFNDYFRMQGKPYLLLGPGRWGTADRWLGVPTKWDQISSARVIVEATYGDFSVTPSFGTHFFQNLIAFQIGYLTVNKSDNKNSIDWDWLNSQRVIRETEYIRHITLDEPMEVLIDGRRGRGAVLKP